MVIVPADVLEEWQKKDIYSILKAVDKEFVPPLSVRNSTRQNSFTSNENQKNDEPWVYYEAMIEQKFILALEGKKVIGFLSYIPNYSVSYPVKKEEIDADYISTIAVASEYRNKGITREMYKTFLSTSKAKIVATRTWSLNHAHIHILESIGFELAETIPNDRGEGIDTVYYQKIR